MPTKEKMIAIFGEVITLPKKAKKPAKVFGPRLVRVTE